MKDILSCFTVIVILIKRSLISENMIPKYALKSGANKGQTLILVLLMILTASLVLIPSLNLVATTLNSTRIHTQRAKEYYAADAGIKYAVYKIKKGEESILSPLGIQLPVIESTPTNTINGMYVWVKITGGDGTNGNPFEVVSTANKTPGDPGSDNYSTRIIATVSRAGTPGSYSIQNISSYSLSFK